MCPDESGHLQKYAEEVPTQSATPGFPDGDFLAPVANTLVDERKH
jgi:hypothetical protein